MALKESELRLGNIIDKLFDGSDKFQWSFYNKTDNFEKYPDHYRAIPLTEEWYKRLGGGFTFAEEFKATFENGVVYVEQYSEGEFPLPHIKYVHQFQNLHFDLTGKEAMLKQIQV